MTTLNSLTSYADGQAMIWHGDCLALLAALPEASVDSIVCDPPYGLGFMGKKWDALPPGKEWAEACLRVLKPGGHLLAFGGSRTWHRLAVAIEDGGFELRDSIAWLYGSGFPKSLDVSKAIDKAAGVEFTAKPASGVGFMNAEGEGGYNVTRNQLTRSGESTAEAQAWQGWGTALKPAFEPVVVGRKPLGGRTVAANVLEHGTGALNIDGCRIEGGDRPLIVSKSEGSTGILGDGLNGSSHGGATSEGRWPANVVLDESQAEALDQQSGTTSTKRIEKPSTSGDMISGYGGGLGGDRGARGFTDSGGASRFFYVAKAPKKERPVVDGTAHPTVKPLALMRWLCRLVTPPGGLVLDTFTGSGTTGEAALLEGFRFLGAEAEADYLPLIAARMERAVETKAEEQVA